MTEAKLPRGHSAQVKAVREMLLSVLGSRQVWQLTEEPQTDFVGQMFEVSGGEGTLSFELLVPDLEPPSGTIHFFAGSCQDDYDSGSLEELREVVEAAVSGRVRVAFVGLRKRSPVLHVQRDSAWVDLLDGRLVDYDAPTQGFEPYG